MAQKSRVQRMQKMHWKSPVVMLGSFLIGIGLSFGHHAFYRSLDGSSISNAMFDQSFNIGIGTAFAFLVRAFLVIAVGVAYVQHFWRDVKARPTPISHIDTIASLLSSIQEFLSLKTLWRHPVLVMLAIISWLIPVATIIPPATLSVRSKMQSDYRLMDVPTINFSNNAFSQGYETTVGTIPDAADANVYNGPTTALNRIAFATALQGSIPALPAPAINSSYSQTFFGPALSCQSMDDSILDKLNPSFGCNISASYSLSQWDDFHLCNTIYAYLAWTPLNDSLVPPGNLSLNNNTWSNPTPPSNSLSLSTVGSFDTQPAALYMASRQLGADESGVFYPWTILNCSLYNASYAVDFNFENGRQQLDVIDVKNVNGVQAITKYWEPYGSYNGAVAFATQASINYQAIMDAFGKLLVGTVSVTSLEQQSEYVYTNSTSVLSTNLVSTEELAPLYSHLNQISGAVNVSSSLPGAQSLLDAVEQLFQNITLSLFTNRAFLSTLNSTERPSTNVTIASAQNVYEYTSSRLLLAYGLAVLFTLLCVTMGGLAFIRSGVSYSNNFSTIMRISRNPEIDALLNEADRSGIDPLPSHIAKAKFALGTGQQTRWRKPSKPRDSQDLTNSIELRESVRMLPREDAE
ncbi:hypothetical protein MMC12_007544 [Toensbergia leucococca]|nr:hypothetical protein [Toensbergia leucococca]